MEIDIAKTKEYYNSLSLDMLCDCDYCKLYYIKSRKEFPELALWLDKYGVDIEKPFEVMSLEPDESGMLEYIGVQYIVFGTFLNDNSYYVGDFNIKIAHSHVTKMLDHYKYHWQRQFNYRNASWYAFRYSNRNDV